MQPRFSLHPPQANADTALPISHGLGSVAEALELHLALDADALLASLTDGKGLLLVGEVPGLGAQLQRLQNAWQRVGQAAEQTEIQIAEQAESRAEALRDFGQDLHASLLPARISRHLACLAQATLRLHVQPELAAIPWEAMHDGARSWQSVFHMARAQLGMPPRAAGMALVRNAQDARIRILLSYSEHATHSGSASALQNLAKRLNAKAQFVASCMPVAALRSEVLALHPAQVFDVLHVAGPLASMLSDLENDAYLAEHLQTAKLLVLDVCDDGAQALPWLEAGPRLARLVPRAAALCLLNQWPGATTMPDAAARCDAFYQAILQGTSIDEGGNAAMDSLGKPPGPSAPELTPASADPSATPTAPYTAPHIAVWGEPQRTLQVRPAVETQARSFRQVTSLSYDLVGSTQLMQRLGAEAYSLALQNYHLRFANIVQRWAGVSDAPQGDDGIMCYFGTLRSDETTVRSAMFAALDLMAEAKHLAVDIRIGLATGQLAVSEAHYVGLSVHLAARIQALAQAGEILLSAQTAKLVEGMFSVVATEQSHSLKGFSETATVYRLEQAKQVLQWSQWTGSSAKSLVGRDLELQNLQAQWQKAVHKGVRYVHIYGEAGIGKSQLMTSFAHGLERSENAKVFICRCIPETSSRAFGPIIALLEQWLQIESTDDLPTRQMHFQTARDAGTNTESDLYAIGRLLGLTLPTAPSADKDLPEPNRRSVLRYMVQWLVRKASQQALLCVVEDIQWADPSTLEFLSLVKAEAARTPLLVLLTQRVDSQSTPHLPIADAQLQLSGLAGEAVRNLIRALAGQTALSKSLVQAIEEKADGVPLFVEMCTELALESGKDGMQMSAPSAQPFQVPPTVRDLLMQRLDSLGAARQLAQICSALGREFSLPLLAAVLQSSASPIDAGRLNRLMVDLLQTGLLLASRQHKNQYFYFRHAMIRDVAYASMWETDRRALHHNIASTIETAFPDIAAAQPELLAHHYAACGAGAQALRYHLQAAKLLKRKEAHAEALVHLDKAKALLPALPQDALRERNEMEIELATAGSLVLTKGYGASSVETSFKRAMALSHRLQDVKALLRSQLGLELYHFARGDFGLAHAYIAQAQATAKDFNDGVTTAICQWVLANVLFHQGEVAVALERMEECAQGYQQAGLRTQLAQSPDVMCLIYSSLCLWELGRSLDALSRADEAIALAQASQQRLGTGQALGVKAMVQLLNGQTPDASTTASQAIAVCEAGEHAMWTAHARFIQGYATAELGDLATGLQAMDAADALWASTGSILTRSFYLSARAKVNSLLGHHDRAQALIHEAWGIVHIHGERYFEPEVLRLKAEILIAAQGALGAASQPQAEVETLLGEALASAQARKLKALELRVLCSLLSYGLEHRTRDADLAHTANSLGQLLQHFPQTSGTQDALRAKQLIAVATQRLAQT